MVSFLLIKIIEISKKGDFENPKVQNCDLVINQCSINAVFQIVRLPGDQKNSNNRGIPVLSSHRVNYIVH